VQRAKTKSGWGRTIRWTLLGFLIDVVGSAEQSVELGHHIIVAVRLQLPRIKDVHLLKRPIWEMNASHFARPQAPAEKSRTACELHHLPGRTSRRPMGSWNIAPSGCWKYSMSMYGRSNTLPYVSPSEFSVWRGDTTSC
jgi:hypothetical protein